MKNLIEPIIGQIQNFLDTHDRGVILLRGPTATGKTSLSIEIAQHFLCEIISADSRQVYKYMNIGTDKITPDQQSGILHHMLDIVTPDQTFTAGQWKDKVYQLIPQIHDRDNTPLIVGGTGLYFDMIYKNFAMPEVQPDPDRRESMMKLENDNPGYLHTELSQRDPDEASKHHPNSTRFILRALEIIHHTGKTKTELARENPVDRPILMLGLMRGKEDSNRLINSRIKEMFDEGLVTEVQGLLDQGYTTDMPAMQGIGYKEIVGYIQGEYDLDRAEELLKRNTHHLAKKQRSRFRRYIAESKSKPKDNVTYAIYDLSENRESNSE